MHNTRQISFKRAFITNRPMRIARLFFSPVSTECIAEHLGLYTVHRCTMHRMCALSACITLQTTFQFIRLTCSLCQFSFFYMYKMLVSNVPYFYTHVNCRHNPYKSGKFLTRYLQCSGEREKEQPCLRFGCCEKS